MVGSDTQGPDLSTEPHILHQIGVHAPGVDERDAPGLQRVACERCHVATRRKLDGRAKLEHPGIRFSDERESFHGHHGHCGNLIRSPPDGPRVSY